MRSSLGCVIVLATLCIALPARAQHAPEAEFKKVQNSAGRHRPDGWSLTRDDTPTQLIATSAGSASNQQRQSITFTVYGEAEPTGCDGAGRAPNVPWPLTSWEESAGSAIITCSETDVGTVQVFVDAGKDSDEAYAFIQAVLSDLGAKTGGAVHDDHKPGPKTPDPITKPPEEPAQSPVPQAQPQPATPVSRVESSATRTAGWVIGLIGVAWVTTGAVTGALAISESNTVKAHCDLKNSLCDGTGLVAAANGNTLATWSTVTFIAGGAALVLGTTLVLTSPRSHSVSVTGALAPGGASAALRGSF